MQMVMAFGFLEGLVVEASDSGQVWHHRFLESRRRVEALWNKPMERYHVPCGKFSKRDLLQFGRW